jgi:hypothetical protein
MIIDKRLLTLFCLITLQLSSLAQKNIYDTITSDICKYLNEKVELPLIKTKKDAETVFARAFAEVGMKHLDRIMDVEGTRDMDEVDFEKVGQKVGIKLMTDCPIFIKVIMPLIEGELESSPDEEEEDEVKTTSGEVTEITETNFVILKLKEADGSIKRFYWLTKFKGAENFDNDPQNCKGKKISIKWRFVEVYNPAGKSFSKERVITGITLQ